MAYLLRTAVLPLPVWTKLGTPHPCPTFLPRNPRPKALAGIRLDIGPYLVYRTLYF